MSKEKMEHQSDATKGSFFVKNVWLSPMLYVYFLSIVTALGMLYIHRENMVNRNSVPPDLAVDTVYNQPISSVPPNSQNAGTKIDVSSLLQPTKEQIARGGELFKVDCASCHGNDGKGDGPASASLNPKPRDFHSTTGWKNGRLLSQMFKTVSEGVSGSAMVSFAGSLPASDRLAILSYIRSTFGDFPKDTPDQLQAMTKTYHLEEVAGLTPHMTLSDAIRQVEESALTQARVAAAANDFIVQHSTDEGSILFNSVVIDRHRALDMLAGSDFWSKNESDFVTVVAQNAVQNGFDPKVAQLTVSQWQNLFGYLKNVFASVGGTGNVARG